MPRWNNPNCGFQKGHKMNIGIKFTDEHIKNLSKSHKGKKITEEQKKKISMALKGRKRLPFTEEQKRKMSEAHKGKKLSKETKRKIGLAGRGRHFKMPNGFIPWSKKHKGIHLSSKTEFKKGHRTWNKSNYGRNCDVCGKYYKVCLSTAKTRKYCSLKCGRYNKSKIMKEKMVERMKNPIYYKNLVERMSIIGKRQDRNGCKHWNWKGGITKYKRSIGNKKWVKFRNFIFKRDNWTCQECKQVGGCLEAHHIKSWKKYPKLRFNKKNCITLCRKCHRKTDNYGCKSWY